MLKLENSVFESFKVTEICVIDVVVDNLLKCFSLLSMPHTCTVSFETKPLIFITVVRCSLVVFVVNHVSFLMQEVKPACACCILF